MKEFTLKYEFNGKKYISTVTATDRVHAMNLIKNKIVFISETKNEDFDVFEFFNENIFKNKK